MKTNIPLQTNKVYLETNRSNILGNIWSTKGIDYQTNLGASRLAQKLVINTSTNDDSNLGRPAAFARFDGRIWAICGTKIFKNSNTDGTSAFVADASTGVPTSFNPDLSDLATFNNRLWATDHTNLWSKAANGAGTGAWTSRSAPSAPCEKLLYFKKTNLLYFVDSENTIASINSADVVNSSSDGDANAIDLTNDVSMITTMVANSTSIWIGTLLPGNTSGAENFLGAILQWDGISAQITTPYPIQAAGVLAMCVLNDIPYAMDTEGRILKYNGYGFEEVARLPVNRTLLISATDSNGIDILGDGRFVHYNGLIATKNNTLMVLVNNLNNDSAGTITENLASGVWECDLDTKNFTHRYNLTYSTLGSSTITDFGQNRIVGVGALSLNTFEGGGSGGKVTIFAGAKIYTDASSSISAIFVDSPANPSTNNEGQKRGYFVTTFIESQEANESWGRMWAMFRKFQNTTDNIVFKYRTSEEDPVEASITWVDTTHFTTTTDVTAYGPTATGFDGHTGGEVEITQGTGSGATPHITNISNNAGTYTVTLDQPVTGVTTGTAKARFQKWVLIGDVYAVVAKTKSWAQMSIPNANENRVQIKCCLQWTGNGEFYRMVVWSNPNNIITN